MASNALGLGELAQARRLARFLPPLTPLEISKKRDSQEDKQVGSEAQPEPLSPLLGDATTFLIRLFQRNIFLTYNIKYQTYD